MIILELTLMQLYYLTTAAIYLFIAVLFISLGGVDTLFICKYSNSLLSPRCGTLYGTSYLIIKDLIEIATLLDLLCTYTGANIQTFMNSRY